ncbi:MAG: low specificity L-threonine aldolase [Planctomycetota bacterium]|nr:MAG: low specificity L-threonine aldolase [Planctomycetota bacterium]
MIDLRSDTVTKPTPAMLAAMTSAPLGDDVFDEDPTVHKLQERVAELLGKEAAVFAPSGTMTNQIGVRVHCQPGDEFLCEAGCHIYNYEQGAYAQLSGLAVRPVEGRENILHVDQLRDLIRGDNEHLVRTRLVCLENTHNRGSGRVLPYDGVAEICAWAHDNGLATHLDGARLFNAAVATGIPANEWAKHFDTVSVCFSKGLGCPIGSALAGPAPLMKQARRIRKLFGGGMRQAGVIAAAALYALDNHIERLAEDHAAAQILADAVRATSGLRLEPDTIDTNIIIFSVDPQIATAHEFVAALRARGVLTLAVSKTRIRAVTHLDVDRAAVARAAKIAQETTAALADGKLHPATVDEDSAAYGR